MPKTLESFGRRCLAIFKSFDDVIAGIAPEGEHWPQLEAIIWKIKTALCKLEMDNGL